MNKSSSVDKLYGARALIGAVFAIALLVVSASFSSAQQTSPQDSRQFQARDLLNRGVEAFKNGQYDEAEQDFRNAKQLDPQLLNASLYLATTYTSQYVPGAPSEENVRYGQDAVGEFKSILILDPQNISAIDGLGSILFQMAGNPYDPNLFTESKSYHQRHIDLRPNDPEPYYWIGVIDWTLSFRANGQFRAKYNLSIRGKQLRDDEPPPEPLRQEYLREYGPTIDEGIDYTKKALKLRPAYDDAMAYLNLLYRRKADTVADESERSQLVKMADNLVDNIKEIKEKRAEQQQ